MPESKLTPPRHEKIIALLRKGAYVVTACAKVGITEQTFWRWMREGQREDGPQRYKKFYADASEAMADFELDTLGKLDEIGHEKSIKEVRCPQCETRFPVQFESNTQLRALQWRLEVKHPDRYGRKGQLEVKVQGEMQRLMDAVEPLMSEDAYVEFLHAAARAMGVAGLAAEEAEESEGEEEAVH